MENTKLKFALAGNPNCGKTTIFNDLTGTRQKVGNWPGVTVEKKEGTVKHGQTEFLVTDLPGIYSLTPYSIEEIISRNYILKEKPDVVINILDASNLTRSLYLTSQLLELGCPLVLALNMADMAEKQGIKIDAEKLSALVGAPVVFTVASKGKGLDAMIEAAIKVAETKAAPAADRQTKFDNDIEAAIAEITAAINAKMLPEAAEQNRRWTAIKLLENDSAVVETVEQRGAEGKDVMTLAEKQRQRITSITDDEPQIIMADQRYGFINGIIREVQSESKIDRVDMSRKIDKVLTNRLLGFPIFIILIWIMFEVTFTVGGYPMEWIEMAVGAIGNWVGGVLPEGWFNSLIVDGIIGGVGGVIVFLPNILILFFFISLFEDTGYLARTAFLMDRIMHTMGLHGKSFIPMLMGFGCTVPAVMGTRTMDNQKNRILTILITPFMSCSARLPVYIILAGAFFPDHAGTVIFSLYLLGIIVAIISGRVFSKVFFKGEEAPFVMELPPYRMPTLKGVMLHMWERGKIFLKRMGTVILLASIIIWFLSAFPGSTPRTESFDNQIAAVETQMEAVDADDADALETLQGEIDELAMAQAADQAENSYLARIGHVVEPVVKPLGLDWRGGVALLSGFAAKEIVVATYGVLLSTDAEEDEEGMGDALKRTGMTAPAALGLMVFTLLYVPCAATVAAIRREASTKWMWFQIVYSTVLAWILAFIVYQVGTAIIG